MSAGLPVRAVVDLHNDLLQELVSASSSGNPFQTRWLGHLRSGDVRRQGCPVYVPAEEHGEAWLRFALC